MSPGRASLLRIIQAKKDEDDDEDLNQFSPRRNKTERGLTPKEVKEKLKAVGVIFTVEADEYTVRLKGQKKDDAYGTDDLDDAFDTGMKMVGKG